MKTESRLLRLTLLLTLALLGFAGLAPAQPYSFTFTYQGRLKVGGGTPDPGALFDYRFKLFDVPTGGIPVAGIIGPQEVPVTDGLFTVSLDFGSNVFTGSPRWLEIEVRPATNNPAAPFTLLSPRQPITPTPQAFYAGTAGTAANFEGTVRSNQLAGTYLGAVAFLNVSNQFAGNGAGLTELNASQIRSGTVSAARLDPNVVLQGQDASFGKIQANGEVTVSGDLFAGRLVAGDANLLTAPYGVIAGGRSNTVTAPFGAVLSGGNNFVASDYSVICGGMRNVDLSHGSFIGGGTDNTIWDFAPPLALGTFADVISGGHSNRIEGGTWCCTIGGGGTNWIGTNCQFSVIAGGQVNTNQPNADCTVIGGGRRNTIQTNADYSLLAGGRNNTIQVNADYAVIGGGNNNVIQTDADNSLIAGGFSHIIQPNVNYAVIAGGANNTIQTNADSAALGGGAQNVVFTNVFYATIPGGCYGAATNYGQQAYASGTFAGAAAGSAQASLYVVRATNATATFALVELYLDGSIQKMRLRPNSTWTFDALVTGRTSGGAAGGFRLEGVIEYQPPAAAAIIGVVAIPMTQLEPAMAGAVVSAVVDPANNALVIKVNAPANSRWVGTVRTAEVIY